MQTPIGECYDCGRKYGGLGWVDAIIPDEIWAIISPSITEDKENGLLCFCCIAKRLEQNHLTDISVKLTSGPFKR